MRTLVVLAGLLALRFVHNLWRLARTRRFLSRFALWLADEDPGLLEQRAEVVSLIRQAGVKDFSLPNVQVVGMGYVSKQTLSVLDNFPNNREDLATFMYRMFREAIGVYRSRMLNTFNPLFWVETLVNLPRVALSYLGVSPDSVATRVLQLAWWAVAALTTLAYALFKPQLVSVLKAVVGRLPG